MKRYNSDASNNFINFNDPEFDKNFALGLTALQTSEKKTYYYECQRILTEDAASVFIQDPIKITAVKKGLAGYTPYPLYVFDASKLYWEEN